MSYLGWESGGTKLVVTLSYDGKTIVESKVMKRPKENKAKESLQMLFNATKELLQDHKLSHQDIRGIGFGFGGNVNLAENSPLLCIHEEGWENLPVSALVEEEFQTPIYLVNDCDAAALSETFIGQQGEFEHLYYVTLGTGVGGALVSNGELFQTSPLGNAEIGHLVVDELGVACPCGSHGCLEAVCSGPGLSNLAAAMFPEWEGKAGGKLVPEEITSAYLEGDRLGIDVMTRYVSCLAKGLGTVMTLLHPDRIVLGGGLGSFVIEHFSDELHTKVQELTYAPFRSNVSIHEWAVKEGAVSVGAILFAVGQLQAGDC